MKRAILFPVLCIIFGLLSCYNGLNETYNDKVAVLPWLYTAVTGSTPSGPSVAEDGSGNIYITGGFKGTVDFDPGDGTDIKIAAGLSDIFLTKIYANGTYGWTKRFGGESVNDDIPHSFTVDGAGNVYITGGFRSTVNFAADFGGTDSKTSVGSCDIFLTKINTNGTYGWTKQFPATSGNSGSGHSVKTDSSGNVYLTGYYAGTVNFAADFGGTDSKSPAVGQDAFITKINANCTYGWTKIFAGSGSDNGYCLVIDSNDNVYLTGSFGNTVNFAADFGGTDNKISVGSSDIFLTKINADGTYGWTKQFGNSGVDSGQSVTADRSGNVYLTGNYTYTVNFAADFGGTDSKTYAGGGTNSDFFLTRINADGTYGWTRSFGGTGYDYPWSVITDGPGNIYLTGRIGNTVNYASDFGGSDIKPFAGTNDIYLTRINADGTYGWTKQFGGTGSDQGFSLAADKSGNLYLAGVFIDTVDFDTGSEVFTGTSGGINGVYLLKLVQ